MELFIYIPLRPLGFMKTSFFLKIALPILSAFIFSQLAFGQKEWSNWYKNGRILLTFKNGKAEKVEDFITNPPPVPPFENLYHFAHWGEGGVSYSDPITGEMKFIISRYLGFGRDYNDFPNDTILRNCLGDKKAYHIIPIPDNKDKFYIIQFQSVAADLTALEFGLQVRCPNAIGLAYSIVDLSKNNGLGDFVSMNNVITKGLTEQITYVRHANGKDVWIIYHPYFTAEYHAILASAAGFSNPVVSTIGPMINGGSRSVFGLLEASHDGKLIVGTRSIPADSGRQYSDIEFFDFDNATGTLSNYRTIPIDGNLSGLQFSPDNSKLYAISNPENYSFQSIYQWDFNKPDLASSRTELFRIKNGSMFDMQLAPDGKIYISRFSEYTNNEYRDYLMTIQCPNLPQYASNLKIRGIEIGYFMFPVLINDFINMPRVIPPPSFSLGNDTSICFGSYTISAPEGWESYQWNTGDTTREIKVTAAGTYYVLTGNTGFSCPSAYGSITIRDKANKLNLGKDTALCVNNSVTLKIPDGYTNIRWNNGSNARDSVLFGGGEIRITANDSLGCFTGDTIIVNQKYYPRADFGKDTVLCNNELLTLRLEPTNIFGGDARYKWLDNSTSETFRVTKPGTYWGTVSYDGCTASDTIRVDYLTSERISLGRDTTLCAGDSLVLSPSISGVSFEWSNGATTPTLTVKNTSLYWVSIKNGSCVLSDSIHVTFSPKPPLELGPDTAVCVGSALILDPGLNGGRFLWQDGSQQKTITVTAPGTYRLQYTQQNCTVRDSIRIDYLPLPALSLGRDTGFCAGGSFLLSAVNPSIQSYRWHDQSTQPFFEAFTAGTYNVTVTGINGCINRDTITLTTTPLPVFSLGRDTLLCTGTRLQLSTAVNGDFFLWNTGNTTASESIGTEGDYWLKVTRQGCSYSDSIRVGYKPIPTFSLGNDTTLCEGNVHTLSVQRPNATFLWQDGSTFSNFAITKPGTYSVTVNLNNCFAADTIHVQYLAKPVLILVEDTSICIGQSFVLRPLLNTTVTYLWQDGSTRPNFEVADTGFYSLRVNNLCGSVVGNVTVQAGICKIMMPTAFTPNSDNLNETFRVKNPFPVKQFKFRIYNRYGEMVFETDTMSIGWDGTYKGIKAPSGSYAWVINAVTNDGVQETQRGTVLLIR